ncbi:MAG: tetratricopeptide repeat protein [Bryobacteraceae bacterium]|nr:tetratricopeptide repeat protein [Bryobacteraceae bacterium]
MASAGEARQDDLFQKGIVLFQYGDLDGAEASFQTGLRAATARGDRGGEGSYLHELGLVAQRRGDPDLALELLRKSMRAKLAAASVKGAAVPHVSETLHVLGALEDNRGNRGAAQQLFSLAREYREAERDYDGLGSTLHSLAFMALTGGDAPAAIGLFMQALRAGRISGDRGRAQKSAMALQPLLAAGYAVTGGTASAARDLPPNLAEPLAREEAGPHNIPAARQALENALVFQLRRIARGLLADRILRSMALSGLGWWHQYASLHDISAEEPALDDPAFLRFRDAFIQDVLHRRVARIRPEQLLETKLRVLGGECFFWQEGRVNQQLADLGSSCRLVVVNAERARLHRAAQILNERHPPPMIRSFLFGAVGPSTAWAKFSFYEVGREFAVSPYLNELSPAFAFECRGVSRQAVPRRFLDTVIAPEGHEIWHLIEKSPFGSRRGLTSWKAIMCEDLCRYLQQPRTLHEMLIEFHAVFDFSNGLYTGSFPPGEQPQPLPDLLGGMCQDGLAVTRDGGRYYSPIFEEGRRWLLA